MPDVLKYEQQGHIVILTLNDPATRNALTGEPMFSGFEQAVDRMNADLSVRAAILTGEGTAFCSGGNVPDMIDKNPPQVVRWTKRMIRESQHSRLETILEMSASYQALAHHTSDHTEAVASMFEKRSPKFTGK